MHRYQLFAPEMTESLVLLHHDAFTHDEFTQKVKDALPAVAELVRRNQNAVIDAWLKAENGHLSASLVRFGPAPLTVGYYLLPLAAALKEQGFSIEQTPPMTAGIDGTTLLEMIKVADHALTGIGAPPRPSNACVVANSHSERPA